MKNPAIVTQRFKSPVPKIDGKKNKGNLPYLRFRRRLRKGVFGKA